MADRRAGARLQPDPARRLCDRHGRLDRAVGRADRSQRQAGRHRLLQRLRRRRADLAGPRPPTPIGRRAQHAAERPMFGGREVPFYGWHYPPFFFAIAVLVAAAALCAGVFRSGLRPALRPIWRRIARNPAPRPETPLIALRLPRGIRQYRPRPERLSHRSAARRRLASAGPPALARRRVVRPARLQAAIRRLDPGRAAGGRTMAHHRRRRRHRCGAARGQLRDARRRRLARVRRLDDIHANVVLEQGGTGWEKIQSIFSAVRMWGGSVPTAYAMQIALALMLAASLALAVAERCRVRTEGRGACHRQPARHALRARLRPGRARGRRSRSLCRHGLERRLPRLRDQRCWPRRGSCRLLSRGIAGVTGVPLGLLAMLALYVLTLRRAALDRAGVMAGARRNRASVIRFVGRDGMICCKVAVAVR